MLNNRITSQQEAHESYSCKDNLLICGIKEQRDETPEMCITAIRDTLALVFKLKLKHCEWDGNYCSQQLSDEL